MLGESGSPEEIENVKTIFAKELCKRLVDHYGRMPSAAVVSRDFNFRCPQLAPISQETARRWIRGLSLPEVERLATLVSWLRLNPNELFKPNNRAGNERRGPDLKMNSLDDPRTEFNPPIVEPQLLAVWPKLDEKARQLLLMLAMELASNRRLNT